MLPPGAAPGIPVRPPSPSWAKRTGLILLLVLGLAILLGLLGPWGVIRCGASNERNGATSLKTIAAAQFDFRSADRDWNDVKDYWRKDIAGLYAQYPATDPARTPLKLIELSIASADDFPLCDLSPYAVRSAKAGYWFRSILHEDEKTPSPDRFAACAYPDSPSAGKWTYIIDEENFVYRKKLEGQRGLDRYPRDPLKSGWERND